MTPSTQMERVIPISRRKGARATTMARLRGRLAAVPRLSPTPARSTNSGAERP
jgi:hypothetical protein